MRHPRHPRPPRRNPGAAPPRGSTCPPSARPSPSSAPRSSSPAPTPPPPAPRSPPPSARDRRTAPPGSSEAPRPPRRRTPRHPPPRHPPRRPSHRPPAAPPKQERSRPAYPGTWTGELTSARGQKSTYTVVLRAAPDANGIVAHTEAHVIDLIPINCSGDAKLAPTDGPGLVLQDMPTPPPTLAGGLAVCVTGGQTHLTLNPDGTLTCELQVTGSGNPKGVLRRTGN
ncbi:hypothetical protein ACU686_19790 [Yinghuangia aomiensis]